MLDSIAIGGDEFSEFLLSATSSATSLYLDVQEVAEEVADIVWLTSQMYFL